MCLPTPPVLTHTPHTAPRTPEHGFPFSPLLPLPQVPTEAGPESESQGPHQSWGAGALAGKKATDAEIGIMRAEFSPSSLLESCATLRGHFFKYPQSLKNPLHLTRPFHICYFILPLISQDLSSSCQNEGIEPSRHAPPRAGILWETMFSGI